MREIWLSLGLWMIFGLPSGETTRRERAAKSGDKPAAVQQAHQPKSARSPDVSRPETARSAPTREAQPAAQRSEEGERRPDRTDPAEASRGSSAHRGHSEVRYGPVLPVPAQDYQ